MRLQDYLDRIGFAGTPCVDLDTLRALHRAHQLTVPFENLDVQLRRPVSLEIEPNYAKVVERRRGGWCYELNGVMGWALREIGFDVMRMGAGVSRDKAGDFNLGNHLCLLVRLDDQPYLFDVGFGGSLIKPLPLRAESREDAPYRVSLRELPLGYWRFSEQTAGGEPFSFDFRVGPADETLFARKCAYLQNDPMSGFVQSLVVQRRTADTHVSLRGRVLSIYRSTGVQKTLLHSGDELVATLRERFDLNVPEASTLWPRIVARHDELFGSSAPQPPGH